MRTGKCEVCGEEADLIADKVFCLKHFKQFLAKENE